jgi:hypothetical protein
MEKSSERQRAPNKIYTYINLEDISMPLYQRPIIKALLRKIINTFDEKYLGVLVVSYRNNKFYLVDGQHRYTAMKRKGYQDAYCEVHYNLTYEQESRMFHDLDTIKVRLNSAHAFNALLEAQDDKALAIKRITEEEGYSISFNRGASDKKLAALSTMQAIYRNGGENSLRLILRTIMQIWDGEKESLQCTVLVGFEKFYSERSNDIDIRHLIQKLTKVPVNALLRNSKQYKVDRSIAFAQAIVNVYNSGKTEKNRIRPIV